MVGKEIVCCRQEKYQIHGLPIITNYESLKSWLAVAQFSADCRDNEALQQGISVNKKGE